MGMPRNHHCIFVETHEDGPKTGYVYQVTGNIQTGMIHEHRKAEQPGISNNFSGVKRLIGTVTSKNYVNIRSAVNSVPPPKSNLTERRRYTPTSHWDVVRSGQMRRFKLWSIAEYFSHLIAEALHLVLIGFIATSASGIIIQTKMERLSELQKLVVRHPDPLIVAARGALHTNLVGSVTRSWLLCEYKLAVSLEFSFRCVTTWE